EIVALVETCGELFMDYPESPQARMFDPYRDTYDNQDDRFHVLRMGQNMPDALARLIIERLELSTRDRASDIRVNRYDPGDYIQPRRDERGKGIFVLTTSAVDGVTMGATRGGVDQRFPRTDRNGRGLKP
ncbi:MAG: hypothetical protein OXT01_15070, partial [Rhodospirillaceae bacterium]|nr:hypothetical protein [Rhodospirillaceae bacterium]